MKQYASGREAQQRRLNLSTQDVRRVMIKALFQANSVNKYFQGLLCLGVTGGSSR